VAKHSQKVSCYYDCYLKQQDRLGLVFSSQSLVSPDVAALIGDVAGQMLSLADLLFCDLDRIFFVAGENF
jgi:hypothetical protein